jgi:RNA polymerase sigma factor (sigma-70 family)
MICRFPSTNWPLVATTREPPSPTSVAGPLDELCGRYWYPVYAYLRQRGHRPDDAEDLTQGFFMHLLAKRVLERAEPERGRLRSLLLTCLSNFVANEKNHLHAKKRGGPAAPARPPADPRDLIEPSDDLTPERIYERQWAVMLLRRVLDDLRAELARAGKERVFDTLRGYLLGDQADAGYRRAAAALNTTEGNARVTVHRLRRRYRELLSNEIARTLRGRPADVDEEIRYLFSVMQRQPRRQVIS